MGFDVGGACAGANAAKLVFDEELSDKGFAETSTPHQIRF